MSVPALGRLEKVEVRDIWQHEALQFTPWLAKEENLALLGETIGLELQLEAQEQPVGPFRADLLCKNTTTGAWALIENQLGDTDHRHLGQLLTYAAGLDAVTIVWIAPRFTNEHRAALDWLNRATTSGIDFFGLEVELWRIGSSPAAPKFNIVAQPNDWQKTVASSVQHLGAGDLSATGQLKLDYWTAFRAYLLAHGTTLKVQKPPADTWMQFSVGRTWFFLIATLHLKACLLRVSLDIYTTVAEAHFAALQEQRDAIEQALGYALVWDPVPGKKVCRIAVQTDADAADRAQWPVQFAWLQAHLEAFHRVFAPRVQALSDGDEAAPSLADLEGSAAP